MIINRVWAMPNKWTFEIKPIKRLIYKYGGDFKGWIDPFAGMNSPAEYTNDLNPEMPTDFHQRANDFVGSMNGAKFKGILLDPPYNLAQLKECYEGIGESLIKDDINYTYSKIKDISYSKIENNGYAICFGWNTVGFGKERGFKLIEILMICHGGHHNDTIVTVERKVRAELF